ncbi:MAG: alanine racemase [Acidimicrobiales bacterium]
MAEGLRRPARAEISVSALIHNVTAMRTLVGDAALCAVVKANAYGHGAALIAPAVLQGGAHSFGVAIVDEGIELRESGVVVPVLVQAEADPSAIEDGFLNSLTLTVASRQGAREVVRVAEKLGGRHRVHLKVDTGMHRMGVDPEHVDEAADLLVSSENVDFEGIFTHFSVADGSSAEDRAFTRAQIALFDEVADSLAARGVAPRVRHLANSAGAMAYPEARQSMVRCGLAIYGYYTQPWLSSTLVERGLSLREVMTLRTRVSAVRQLEAGERPSYGRQRALTQRSYVATVPFGYADGYARRLFDAGAEVLIAGQRRPLAGIVTMDQLLVDCGDDEVRVGDEVVLMGRQGDAEISCEELARLAGTITHEIVCAVSARVPRVLVA